MATMMPMLALAFVAVLYTTGILGPMKLDCGPSFGESFAGIFSQTVAIMSCSRVNYEVVATAMFMVITAFTLPFHIPKVFPHRWKQIVIHTIGAGAAWIHLQGIYLFFDCAWVHWMVDVGIDVMFMVATTFASIFYTTISLAYQRKWVMTWYHYSVNHLFVYLVILVAIGDLPQANGNKKEERHKHKHKSSFPMWLIHSILLKRWIFVLILLGTLIFGAFIWTLMVKLYKWSLRTTSLPQEDIIFLESLTILPPKFSYRRLQLATTNFSKELGRGGFGIVYEGDLFDGTKVAVKKLQRSRQGQQQYRAEISSLGSVHHQNIIQLYGFCFEGVQRMLVYELMVNGSLDQWLFGDKFLPWAIRFQIVVDIANGLCYLHKDCTKRIIHFDLKPHNILLDNQFRAKITDFGMSVLCNKEETQVMAYMRGTNGYYAPDWLNQLPITEKCDVYSFGRVLLEIVGGRKNIDGSLELERCFFPSLVANKIKEEGGCRDITDVRLRDILTADDWDQVYRTIKIALWCINDNPLRRPSMDHVILMLNGIVVVDNPPLIFDFLIEGGY